MPPDRQLAFGPDLLDKAAADQLLDRVPGRLALEALGQDDATVLALCSAAQDGELRIGELGYEILLGLLRQPALSPRQPREGSGAERWREEGSLRAAGHTTSNACCAPAVQRFVRLPC